ncbi:hypothetical protein BCR32DRAFT_278367 [Anaeromyces robustus]|uniref:Uncharacterized protein n=1 Tax=Anaeromyces robustus TaxID=1754192 RepID=A0A1Y1XBE6_9FUNG|nr:hypothetical protein BCR32DRAFT_278367 [Anaeromyces robustus]|eukprot:ORX83058.1 hypothetical protein BCR32DRAFT_278367 [Anaeromyces robustus]
MDTIYDDPEFTIGLRRLIISILEFKALSISIEIFKYGKVKTIYKLQYFKLIPSLINKNQYFQTKEIAQFNNFLTSTNYNIYSFIALSISNEIFQYDKVKITASYNEKCNYIRSIKNNIRKNLFFESVKSVYEHFTFNNSKKEWEGLRKLSKSSYSHSPSPNFIKDANGNFLFSNEDKFRRFAEHYRQLASDVTGHSLDEEFWINRLDFPKDNSIEWNINGPIKVSKNLKLEFSVSEDQSNDSSSFSESNIPHSVKCLDRLFNKIWNGDFPSK